VLSASAGASVVVSAFGFVVISSGRFNEIT
jgi:hypothetical protein